MGGTSLNPSTTSMESEPEEDEHDLDSPTPKLQNLGEAACHLEGVQVFLEVYYCHDFHKCAIFYLIHCRYRSPHNIRVQKIVTSLAVLTPQPGSNVPICVIMLVCEFGVADLI